MDYKELNLNPRIKAVVFCSEYILFNTLQMSFGQYDDNLKLVSFFFKQLLQRSFCDIFVMSFINLRMG